jgi:hypothetical protein
VRRLFPTFVRGWPAVGLLLLRLVVAVALLDRAGSTLWHSPPLHLAVVSAVLVISALLLLVGLWTPIAASLITVTELWKIFAFPSDRWIYILLGALAAALVMLGPGAFSFDARLYGWKRIELPTRKG